MREKFKKTLLSVLGVTLGATSVMAEASAPSLKIGGNSIINAYFTSQKVKSNGKGGAAGPHISIDVADLYFLISGMTSNGIKYGYNLNFQAFPGSSPTIDQNYIEFSGNFGVIQIGAVVGPEDSMIKDGITMAAATGAADGGYNNTYNVPEFVMRGNDVVGDTGKATKIAWYSPAFFGFRVGVAYTPNTNHMGDSKLNTANGDGNPGLPGNRTFIPVKSLYPFGLRNLAVGLSYKAEMGKWGFTGTGALVSDRSYMSINDARQRVRNTFAYQLGAIIDYATTTGLLQLGGGYYDNGKSRLPSQGLIVSKPGAATPVDLGNLSEGNAGKAWNMGTAYTFGAYKVSATYQETKRKINAVEQTNLKVMSVGGEIAPVQGLKFFTEVNYIRGKTPASAVVLSQQLFDLNSTKQTTVGNNTGTVVVLGTKVSF